MSFEDMLVYLFANTRGITTQKADTEARKKLKLQFVQQNKALNILKF
jgi:hypothetical protein